MKRGMTLNRDATKKVDRLVVIVRRETGFPVTRAQVLEGVLDSELKLHESMSESKSEP